MKPAGVLGTKTPTQDEFDALERAGEPIVEMIKAIDTPTKAVNVLVYVATRICLSIEGGNSLTVLEGTEAILTVIRRSVENAVEDARRRDLLAQHPVKTPAN